MSRLYQKMIVLPEDQYKELKDSSVKYMESVAGNMEGTINNIKLGEHSRVMIRPDGSLTTGTIQKRNTTRKPKKTASELPTESDESLAQGETQVKQTQQSLSPSNTVVAAPGFDIPTRRSQGNNRAQSLSDTNRIDLPMRQDNSPGPLDLEPLGEQNNSFAALDRSQGSVMDLGSIPRSSASLNMSDFGDPNYEPVVPQPGTRSTPRRLTQGSIPGSLADRPSRSSTPDPGELDGPSSRIERPETREVGVQARLYPMQRDVGILYRRGPETGEKSTQYEPETSMPPQIQALQNFTPVVEMDAQLQPVQQQQQQQLVSRLSRARQRNTPYTRNVRRFYPIDIEKSILDLVQRRVSGINTLPAARVVRFNPPPQMLAIEYKPDRKRAREDDEIDQDVRQAVKKRLISINEKPKKGKKITITVPVDPPPIADVMRKKRGRPRALPQKKAVRYVPGKKTRFVTGKKRKRGKKKKRADEDTDDDDDNVFYDVTVSDEPPKKRMSTRTRSRVLT